MKIPFRRGNDGLTDRQRARYANRWRNGAGRAPSRDEMDEIRRLTAAPTESQIEAARLLIKMLTEDGEPVDPELRAVAAMTGTRTPDERDDVHLMPAGEDGHYHGWDCYCVPPWTDADGVRTYHHRDASYWANP